MINKIITVKNLVNHLFISDLGRIS